MLEGKKISELDTVTNLQQGCCFPVLSTGATKRITFGSLLSEIENNLPETGIEQVKEDVATLKNRADETSENINTLNADVENVKETVANVDEMVQGQNATIRNCVSTVEDLERTIEQTHFDDVLELEEQVRVNAANIERNAESIEHNAENIETKLDKTTDAENAGKAVVVDEEGNLTFGEAGVQVSQEEGNAIETKEDGIYVPSGLSGVPIGIIISWASDNIPAGFLDCNGQVLNRSDYPVLYTRVPSNCIIDENTFRVPDLREMSIVGVGENATETIAAHNVYTLGQFKDDQLQGHEHKYIKGNTPSNNYLGSTGQPGPYVYQNTETETTITSDNTNGTPRTGTTTHGKQYGLHFIIKATDYSQATEDVIDDTKFTTGNVLSAAKTKELVDEKNTYSTEEKVVGEWIDGKPIYRKVLIVTQVQVQDNIDLSNLNIETLKKISGYGYNSQSTTDRVNINFYLPSFYFSMYFKENTKTLISRSTNNMNNVHIILEYTKTTD